MNVENVPRCAVFAVGMPCLLVQLLILFSCDSIYYRMMMMLLVLLWIEQVMGWCIVYMIYYTVVRPQGVHGAWYAYRMSSFYSLLILFIYPAFIFA